MAVVGAGALGRCQALALADYDHSELVSICDINESKAKALATDAGCAYTTRLGDFSTLDVDAVVVSTPDSAHLTPTLAMINSGRHIFVEKPLATSTADAETLVQAARRAGVKTMIDFQLRWHPAFMELKRQLLADRLGTPYLAYARASNTIAVPEKVIPWSGESGPEWFLMSHLIDLFTWYLEKQPISVYAAARTGILKAKGIDCYDAIQVQMRFPGTTVTLESSWIVPDSWPSPVDSYLSIYGTKGKAELDDDFRGFVVAGESIEYPWSIAGERNLHGRLDHFMYEPVRTFVDHIRHDTDPAPGFDSGLKVTQAIEAIHRSIESADVVEIVP
ncbi:MAG: hypothetical protein GEU68_14185 [Actinobacteria bacterium]|nr:hypothetical protein [Actinomycetota bacterium]